MTRTGVFCLALILLGVTYFGWREGGGQPTVKDSPSANKGSQTQGSDGPSIERTPFVNSSGIETGETVGSGKTDVPKALPSYADPAIIGVPSHTRSVGDIARFKAHVSEIGKRVGSNIGSSISIPAVSDLIERAIGEQKNKLTEALQRAEIGRARYDLYERPESMTAKVTISAPSPAEKASFEQLSMDLASGISDEERQYFLVDAQRMRDQFLHFESAYRVVYLYVLKAGRIDETGKYWVFNTDEPQLFGIQAGGAPEGPPGVPMYHSYPWLTAFEPPARYVHLFQRF